MMKCSLTPQSDTITLSIPFNYIGKRVEILLYTDEELHEETSVGTHDSGVARFKGLLKDSEADKYQQYLQKARQEWDRTI
jgi:tRNA isopentenyl-2-thiomethyl-A-37 hydroxylase MiaE